MKGFEPRVLGIVCNWCSYAAADGAGAARVPHGANLVIVRVMCTGRIDPGFLLHALSSGFDGVLIGGCHTGDCHYRNGNCKAAFRIRLLQRLMQQAGLEAFRVRRIWAGAAEGKRWAQEAEAFTAQLREAGPQRASGSRTATLQSTPG